VSPRDAWTWLRRQPVIVMLSFGFIALQVVAITLLEAVRVLPLGPGFRFLNFLLYPLVLGNLLIGPIVILLVLHFGWNCARDGKRLPSLLCLMLPALFIQFPDHWFTFFPEAQDSYFLVLTTQLMMSGILYTAPAVQPLLSLGFSIQTLAVRTLAPFAWSLIVAQVVWLIARRRDGEHAKAV
jgi:hypothetical protein